MMKRLILTIITVIILGISIILNPYDVNAKEANTINELNQELINLQEEKAANDRAKNQTQSQIDNNKNAVYKAYQEQKANETKVVEAENKITESEAKIVTKTEETNELLRFKQIAGGENAYLEYISGAKSTTDLIMRTAIIEQLSIYNKQIMDELNSLIEENKALKEELIARNQELKIKQEEYSNAIKKLGKQLSELSEITASYSDQIRMKQELIKYYKSVCKSDSQPLTECVGVYADTSFLRPVNKGYVSSNWGYRTHPITGKLKFHNAIDIAGNSEGTPVYAAANGLVSGLINRASCGGNTVYIQHIINGKYYTTQYTHLLSYSVKVGQVVTKFTQIGQVGGGAQTKKYDGCTTGAHLHFGIANGHYLGSGANGYTSYNTYLSKSVNPLNYLPGGASRWTARG